MEISTESVLRKNAIRFVDRCISATNETGEMTEHVCPVEVPRKNIDIAINLFESLLDYVRYLFDQHEIRIPSVSHSILSLVKHHVAIFKFEAEQLKLPVIPEVVAFEQMLNRLLIPLADHQNVNKIFKSIPPESELSFLCMKLLDDFYEHFYNSIRFTNVWCIPDPEIDLVTGSIKSLELSTMKPTTDIKGYRYPIDTDHDYMLDVDSLQKMIFYLDMAIKSIDDIALAPRYTITDISTANRTVQRALQVLGEYMKNTETSRHLSKETQSRLIAKKVPVDYLSPIRNSFSHSRIQLLTTQRKSLGHHKGELLKHYSELKEIRDIVMKEFIDVTNYKVLSMVRNFELKNRINNELKDVLETVKILFSSQLDSGDWEFEKVRDFLIDHRFGEGFDCLIHGILSKCVVKEMIDVWKMYSKQEKCLSERHVQKLTKRMYLASLDARGIADWLKEYNQPNVDNVEFSKIEDLKSKFDGNQSEMMALSGLQKDYSTDLINSTFWECFFDEFETELAYVSFLEENNIGHSLTFDKSLFLNQFQNHNSTEFLEIINILQYHKKMYKSCNDLYAMLIKTKTYDAEEARQLIDNLRANPHLTAELLRLITSEDRDWELAKTPLIMAADKHKAYFAVESFFLKLYFEKENSNIDYRLLHTMFEKLKLTEHQCQTMRDMIAKLIQNYNLSHDATSIFDDIIKETLDCAFTNLPLPMDGKAIALKFDNAKIFYDKKQQLLKYIPTDQKTSKKRNDLAKQLDKDKILEFVKDLTNDQEIIRKCERFPVGKLINFLKREFLVLNPYDNLMDALAKKLDWMKLLKSFTSVCEKMFNLEDQHTQIISNAFTKTTKNRYKMNFFESQFELEKTLQIGCSSYDYFTLENVCAIDDVEIIIALEIIVLNMLNDLKDFPGNGSNYSQIEYLILLFIDKCYQNLEINYLKLRNCLAHGNPLVDSLNMDLVKIVKCASFVLVTYGTIIWDVHEKLQEYRLEDLQLFLKSTSMWDSDSILMSFIDHLNSLESDNRRKEPGLSKKVLVVLINQEIVNATIENNVSKYILCQKINESIEDMAQPTEDKLACLYHASCFNRKSLIEHLLDCDVKVNDCTASGLTAMHGACANNNCDIIEILLDKGATVNCTSTAQKLTPLHLAVLLNHHEAVEALLANSAVVNVTTRDKQTPLHMALTTANYKLTKLLLCKSANVDAVNAYGRTPLHLAVCSRKSDLLDITLARNPNMTTSCETQFTPLQFAVACNNINAVMALLKNGADINKTSIKGISALHVAAMLHDDDDEEEESNNCCQRILKQLLISEEQLFVADINKRIPLHYAAKEDNIVALQLLMAMNNSSSHLDAKDSYKLTPLGWAVARKYKNIVDHLLKAGADPNSVDMDGNIPLHIAALKCDVDITRLLLQSGASLILENNSGNLPLHWITKTDVRDEDQITRLIQLYLEFGGNINCQEKVSLMTPLSFACKQDTIAAVNSLLYLGADTEIVDRFQFTPLLFSVYNNNRQLFAALKKRHANIHASSDLGLTPLHLISYKGCFAIGQQLLNLGADPNVKTSEQYFCQTPLHLAVQHHHIDIVTLLLAMGADINALTHNGQNALFMAILEKDVEIVRHLLEYEHIDLEYVWNGMINVLHLAVMDGHKDIVSCLLEQGALIDSRDSKNFTSLMHASERGYSGIVRMLLDHGADVNASGTNGSNALIEACTHGHKDVVAMLLDKGAVVDSLNENFISPLASACCQGHLDVVQLLIQHGADLNAVVTNSFSPLASLGLAVFCGRANVAAFLLSSGANPHIAERDGLAETGDATHGMTLLHFASCGGCLINCKDGNGPLEVLGRKIITNPTEKHFAEIVLLLIESGLDVFDKNTDQEIPLHLAAKQGLNDVVNVLLDKGSPIEMPNISGHTPLLLATAAGHTDTVVLLLERGALLNVQSNNGENAIYLAASRGFQDILRLLLDKGVALEIRTKDDRTPLSEAVRYGHLETVKLLFKLVSDKQFHAQTNHGYNLLHIAVSSGNREIVKFLLDEGSEVNAYSRDGITPLLLACNRGYFEIVQVLLDVGANVEAATVKYGSTPLAVALGCGQVPVAQLLLGNGANIYATDYNGELILHYAARSDSKSIIRTLLFIHYFGKLASYCSAPLTSDPGTIRSNLVADTITFVNCRNRVEHTPLHLAAAEGNVEALLVLLQGGSLVDARDSDGTTPMQLAASRGRLEACRLLLEWGADIDKRDLYGISPLHLACCGGHSETVTFLLSEGAHLDTYTGNHPFWKINRVNLVMLEWLRKAIKDRPS